MENINVDRRLVYSNTGTPSLEVNIYLAYCFLKTMEIYSDYLFHFQSPSTLDYYYSLENYDYSERKFDIHINFCSSLYSSEIANTNVLLSKISDYFAKIKYCEMKNDDYADYINRLNYCLNDVDYTSNKYLRSSLMLHSHIATTANIFDPVIIHAYIDSRYEIINNVCELYYNFGMFFNIKNINNPEIIGIQPIRNKENENLILMLNCNTEIRNISDNIIYDINNKNYIYTNQIFKHLVIEEDIKCRKELFNKHILCRLKDMMVSLDNYNEEYNDLFQDTANRILNLEKIIMSIEDDIFSKDNLIKKQKMIASLRLIYENMTNILKCENIIIKNHNIKISDDFYLYKNANNLRQKITSNKNYEGVKSLYDEFKTYSDTIAIKKEINWNLNIIELKYIEYLSRINAYLESIIYEANCINDLNERKIKILKINNDNNEYKMEEIKNNNFHDFYSINNVFNIFCKYFFILLLIVNLKYYYEFVINFYYVIIANKSNLVNKNININISINKTIEKCKTLANIIQNKFNDIKPYINNKDTIINKNASINKFLKDIDYENIESFRKNNEKYYNINEKTILIEYKEWNILIKSFAKMIDIEIPVSDQIENSFITINLTLTLYNINYCIQNYVKQFCSTLDELIKNGDENMSGGVNDKYMKKYLKYKKKYINMKKIIKKIIKK